MIDRPEVLDWLRASDEERLAVLWERADRARREHVGDVVHLRGLVEISSHCVRRCAYCGLHADNTALARYRMDDEQVLACARLAVRFGYGTLVLQGGEDYGLGAARVEALVRRLKAETPLAVTLSLGERPDDDTLRWRRAGADRYLLRFETGNRDLYARVHPALPGRASDRLGQLRRLREQGYEVGSGILIGLPGQSWDDLADDLMRFREVDLDMIGIGPYLPHPATPLGRVALGVGDGGLGAEELRSRRSPHGTGDGLCPASEPDGNGDRTMPAPLAADRQVPNDETTTLKAVALTRLLCPQANIPSTTALATLDRAHGRELGLRRGANVVMPNLTPPEYRAAYEIYPGKAGVGETAEACEAGLQALLVALGRSAGSGRGDAPALHRRRHEEAR